MTFDRNDRELTKIVETMTNAEKVALLSGSGIWRTAANYRLNVPEIVMTDGTYGVRYSVEQIDGTPDEASGLQQFLEVVNRRSTDAAEAASLGSTKPATCFPNGSSFGCSWDVDLAHRLGVALAEECQYFGINLLLGPGINIRRVPLAGRSYEYYSEDPVISGDIAAGLIRGLQEQGVGATLKHFACNNSEIERTTMSSEVDERALREIYLAGFERAISKSDPWAIMSSYNPVNGVQAAENSWLLSTVLRNEWGYGGLVMSDWHGIKNRVASVLAGNDLDMPESASRKAALLAAIDDRLIESAANQSCLRILQLLRRARKEERRSETCDFDAHHELARRMAAESLVLLKNSEATLPINGGNTKKILVVGEGAIKPIIQGSGSATTNPTQIDIPLDEIKRLAEENFSIVYCAAPNEVGADPSEVIQAAAAADIVIVFANTDVGWDGEGSDRIDLRLAQGQDDLISELAKSSCKTVVVLASPDAVEMPWIDEVDAVVACFFPGQGGGRAIADVLFGKQNPCGKLTVSFPVRLEDTPGYHSYPGENDRHQYSEGIFVGYRYYDLKRIEPLFSFGHGLSYTSYEYTHLSLDQTNIEAGTPLRVSFKLTNTGDRSGKEIAQLYIRPIEPGLKRPIRELKAFRKVGLAPGETETVEFILEARDFQYYDTMAGRWVLRAKGFQIEVGASSRDLRLSQAITCTSEKAGFRRLTIESQPFIVARNPMARERFLAFFRETLKVDESEAEKLFEYTTSSFIGIFNTLTWFMGNSVTEKQVQGLLDEINGMGEAEESGGLMRRE
ncbi:glycosyl hydrolase [Agrobacterium rhizogenes]|uniref:beta-glucosidase n=1 Tax=Rhizobium rhizogenes TaxID=359 RepID=UPI001573256E|nr:glycoside hydrolase family 3 C-terminal domain-containing protein [Rhizobium rhizogenes]NTH16733.1 glycosyl hydrolase [Rhizobium rhizogenes]